MRQTDIIAAAYDAGVDDEFKRLTETPLREFEFHLITEAIQNYLKPGSVVIDIGSGPGRYAEYLIERNYKVGLVDLSAKSLKAFHNRLPKEAEEKVLFNEVSCATCLDWIEPNFADGILLMGPMYHLTDTDAQKKVLQHCHRILKPDGYLITIFMSIYPILNMLIKKDPFNLHYINNSFEKITYTDFKGFKVPQYRCWPDEAIQLLDSCGFYKLSINNIEGIASHLSELDLLSYQQTEAKQQFFSLLKKTCDNKNLTGITHQYMVISKTIK